MVEETICIHIIRDQLAICMALESGDKQVATTLSHQPNHVGKSQTKSSAIVDRRRTLQAQMF